MARVKVFLYASVREAAGVPSIEVEASDLRSLVDSLKAKSSPALARLLDESIRDPDRLVVLVNGRNVGRTDPKKVKLTDMDEIALFPPVSGG